MRMAADTPLFRRDEVLAGLPARRAATILYAIERRTALAVHRSRTVLATYLTPGTAQEQEAAFLGALAAGRGGTTRPSAQDLERYAPEWRDLVPDDPGTRAAIARAHGMTVMVGCMIESSIGITAAAHFTPLVDIVDLDGAALLAHDPFVGATIDGGQVSLPTEPGLGVRRR